MEELLKAIRHGRPWIDSFTRFAYRDAFNQYRTMYEPVYVGAVQAYESMEKLAQEIVDAIETGWKKEKFWNRSAARVDDKMMLVAYLTPMLLASQEVRCHELAAAICGAWNEKFPQNTYETADYDTLLDGFRNSIMGFDFEGKHYHKKD